MPGLVIDIVVPAKSSTVKVPARAFLMTASYALTNCAKSSDSQPFTDGTKSWRDPSGFAKSIAIPKFMCSGFPIAGFPSSSPKNAFISGIARTALTIA